MDSKILLDQVEKKVDQFLFDEAQGFILKLLDDADPIIQFKARYLKIFSDFKRGRFIDAREAALHFLHDYEYKLSIEDKKELSIIYYRVLILQSLYYDVTDDPKQFIRIIYIAKDKIENALVSADDDITKIYDALGFLHMQLALHYYRQGNLDDAIKQYERGYNYYQGAKNDVEVAFTYTYIGLFVSLKGNLSKGLTYQFKSVIKLEQLGYKARLAIPYNNIGEIYKLKGEYDLALEYYELVLKLYKESLNKRDLSTPLSNIGSVYFLRGEYEKARDKYLEALRIDLKSESVYDISDSLYNLIRVYIKLGDIDKAKKYLQDLKKLQKKSKNKIVELRKDFSEALVLKTSNRVKNKVDSLQILYKISFEPIIDTEIYTLARIALIELLLWELRNSGEPEVIEEINENLENLEEFAKEQNAFNTLIECYILQSQVALIELQVNLATSLLNKAFILARDHEITVLEKKVLMYQDEMQETIDRWMKLLGNNLDDIQERRDELKIDELLNKIINKRAEVKNIEEDVIDPVLYLILTEGGVKIYEKKFNDETNIKSSLISGLLTAIHGLSEDVFYTRSSIQRIKHDEYTVLIKPEKHLLFCFVFKGKSYSAIRKLDMIIELLNESETIWKALTRKIPGLTKTEAIGMDLIIEDIFDL